MEYRVLPRGNEQISVLGLGMGGIGNSNEKEIKEILLKAIDSGINFFDHATYYSWPFKVYGEVYKEYRDRIYTQMHFGACFKNGKYGWTRDLDTIKEKFEWELKVTNSKYTDFGMVHCIDEKEDWDVFRKNGIWDYMIEQYKEGRIRHLGFSSHNPKVARAILETGKIDLFMFSINPAYDYKKGSYGIGEVDERASLYRDCQREGIAISVMKPFGGGQLLDKRTSPFKEALTRNQCIKYALDRPGVITVLPGVNNMSELNEYLEYLNASNEEKDYSKIASFSPDDALGNCVYCNHCAPCPVELNVGLINKYYDLSKIGDELARDHYMKLTYHASDCIACGHCNERCPFHVDQIKRMEEIKAYFEC